MTQRGADTHDLVRSYGSSNTAATHENAPIYFSIGHGASKRDREIWVVVVTILEFVAEVNHLVIFCR